jgi:hypothetical protein
LKRVILIIASQFFYLNMVSSWITNHSDKQKRLFASFYASGAKIVSLLLAGCTSCWYGEGCSHRSCCSCSLCQN